MLDTGYWMLDVGCGMWDVGCGMWDVGKLKEYRFVIYFCVFCMPRRSILAKPGGWKIGNRQLEMYK